MLNHGVIGGNKPNLHVLSTFNCIITLIFLNQDINSQDPIAFDCSTFVGDKIFPRQVNNYLFVNTMAIVKTVEPKTPATGLSDIKKSFEKIAMTFFARTKIKGIEHQSYLSLY